MQLPLIKGERESNLDYRDNLPVNMTAIYRPTKGAGGYLLTHDGLTEFSQTGGKARGGVFNERFNEHFRVSGNDFERVNTDGSINALGIVSGSSIASLANSFNTQAILSDGKYYLWDGATLTDVLDPELGVPIDITWFRGIYVMTDGESLFHTDVVNEASINPLKYSSSEFAADSILGVARNDQNQILAFNRYSIEYFYFNPNVPVGTSVLQVITGKAIRAGIVGTHCKTRLDGMFFILGGRKEESPSIHILNGGQLATVATREVDKIIGQYTESEMANVVLESRAVDRDKFVIVHLPNETLLYNHTIAQSLGKDQAWTIVKTGVATDEPWRGKFGVFDPRIARWIYGDTKENKLGYLNQKSASQYGEQVENVLYTPIVPVKQQSINDFEIETIPGYSASDVTASFSMSYDSITYGLEYFNAISTPDDYNTRYIARQLGYVSDDFNFKFRVVSHDKVAFSGLKVNEL